MRRLLLRAALAVAWIILGIVIFINFRGHTLLVDNQGSDAPDLITVSVNGGKALEFFRGDRDRFAVTGRSHRIRVEFSGGREAVERRFRLPISENMYLLSIPKMINGEEPFVAPFQTVPEPYQAEAEEENLGESGIEVP